MKVDCVALGGKSRVNQVLTSLFWSFFKNNSRIALTPPNSDLSAIFTITGALNTLIRVFDAIDEIHGWKVRIWWDLRFVQLEKCRRSLV